MVEVLHQPIGDSIFYNGDFMTRAPFSASKAKKYSPPKIEETHQSLRGYPNKKTYQQVELRGRKIYNPAIVPTNRGWMRDARQFGHLPFYEEKQTIKSNFKPVSVEEVIKHKEEHGNPRPHPLRSKVPCIPKADLIKQYGVKYPGDAGGLEDKSTHVFVGVPPSVRDAENEHYATNLKYSTFNQDLSASRIAKIEVRNRLLTEQFKHDTQMAKFHLLHTALNPDEPDTYNFLYGDTDQLAKIIHEKNKQVHLRGKEFKRDNFKADTVDKHEAEFAAAVKKKEEADEKKVNDLRSGILRPDVAVRFDEARQMLVYSDPYHRSIENAEIHKDPTQIGQEAAQARSIPRPTKDLPVSEPHEIPVVPWYAVTVPDLAPR
jgi:hypothetical protein